jgi:hypothetical protein
MEIFLCVKLTTSNHRWTYLLLVLVTYVFVQYCPILKKHHSHYIVNTVSLDLDHNKMEGSELPKGRNSVSLI